MAPLKRFGREEFAPFSAHFAARHERLVVEGEEDPLVDVGDILAEQIVKFIRWRGRFCA